MATGNGMHTRRILQNGAPGDLSAESPALFLELDFVLEFGPGICRHYSYEEI